MEEFQEVMARPSREFEKECAKSFDVYQSLNVAFLSEMPVPMAPAGFHPKHKRMMYAPKGKSPFDFYGYTAKDATMIGCEIKLTANHESGLPLIAPAKAGNGLQWHQLDALYNLAKHSGVARVVWNNGGVVGVLTNERIINAWTAFSHAVAAIASNKIPAKGSRSISWDLFTPIDYTQHEMIMYYDWLVLDELK